MTGGNWAISDDGSLRPATTHGVDDALPGVPTFGFFSPPTLIDARGFSSTVTGTTIVLNDGGYFVLGDGTRYTCTNSDGCTIENGRVAQGTVTESAATGSTIDTFPTFRNATAPGDRTYTVGTAIEALTLPGGSGGNGALTYSLSPSVPGLSFDASTRRLTGTPSMAGAYAMLYTVADEDGDTDTLAFAIVVESADDGGDTEAVEFDLHEDNFFPQGIAHAHGRFYVVDALSGKVYAYGGDGQQDAAAEFDLHEDNADPVGIAHGNDRFYVVDSTDGRTYAYGGDGQRDTAAEFDLHEDNGFPGGIAYDDGRFHVVDWFNHRVFTYDLDGQRDTSAEFDLHEDNTIPSGIAYARGRFYVVDEFDARVYAYEDDGQRDTMAEFDLHEDNGFPGGIAYADGRFHVVDWLSVKVYGYRDSGASPDLGPTDPDDRAYTVGTPIEVWTLPEASGGDAPLTYSLSPDVPGLRFDAETRQLTGTPSAAGTYSMTFTATDEDGDADTLSFTITVQAPVMDGDTAYGVDDALPGVPAFGIFVPAVVSVGRVMATGDGTTIDLDDGGYFELIDGTRYTCTSSDGCTIENGIVIQGTLTGTAATEGAVDRFPTFRMAMAPVNQTYTVGTAIDALTLPEASGGNGTLTYSLSPDVPGLTFSAAARQLTGTPSAAASYSMTYTVFDADGDTDVIFFTIAVEDAEGGDQGAVAEYDLHEDNSFPQGITYAGDRIYVLDSSDGKVYAYRVDGQRDTASEFDLHDDNADPEGIAYGNERFHVVDATENRIYAYSSGGQRHTEAEFDLHEDNANPVGIAYGNGRLFVVDALDERVFVYGADGQRDTLAEFTLHDDNSSPRGITVANNRAFVVDSFDVKVYVYADGQRDASTEFDLHADNGFPGGIAHADGRFYVVDWVSEKAYVYSVSSANGPATDTIPTFDEVEDPGNRTYTIGVAIETLTLPPASGGDGMLRFGLSPAVPGLTFDAATRQLTGTPTAAGRYRMTYTVTDADGDTDSLNFTITVEHSGQSVYDPYRAYRVDDLLPNVPTSGAFHPAALSRGGISATADGTSIFLVQDGYIVLDDGTRYTCTSADGCGIENGAVTRGTVSVGAIPLDAENGSASGIAYANGRFHVADGADDKVYAYTTAGQRDPSADFNLDAGSDYATGIAHADGRLVVVDGGDLTVYAYSATGQRDPSADFDLDAANDHPSGIVYANGRLYVLDIGDSKAYAYLVSGQREASSDFDLHADNDGPTGLTHANGRFYVLDINDDKIYGYLESGQRDPAAEFDLYGDNRGPSGVTYLNDRLIVTDSQQDRVYFYPLAETGLHFPEGASATRTMPENLPSGINVGEPVSATGGEMLSYTIGGADASSFSIVPDTGQIRTVEDVVYDYETKNEYRVEVGAANERGDRDTIDVTIHLRNLVASCGSSDELNLRTTAADGRLALRWNPVQPVDGQQGAVGYETEIRRGDTAEWTDRRTFLGRTFAQMVYEGLDNEFGYQVRVRAVNEEGTCGWSIPVPGVPTADLAPESPTEYIDRHGPQPLGTPERHIRFLTPQRCRHTGGGVTADANCSYESTGPDTGRIFLEFDDPSRASCEVTLAYSSLTAGSFIDECFDAGVNTDVPFDTSFTMPPLPPRGEGDPDPPPTQSEPQRAPRDQDEFDALVHGSGDFIPGLCFGYCGIPGTPGLSRGPGVATRIRHGNNATAYDFGDYTYENTGPSQGIVSLTMRRTGEVWSFSLDVEPSGNIRVTVTPPDGGETVWPGLQHLDLSLGAQTVLLPIPPSWSAAIAVETDVAPADVDGLHDLARGTCASEVQPAMCALLGDVWNRAFIGPDGQSTLALVHDHGYRKVGRNRGEVTVTWALYDGYSHSDLSRFQMELEGTTWVFDLAFTSDGAAVYILTVTRDGHLPTVEGGFVDFVGDGIDLETFPDELRPPDDPPQASGEDVSGVEVAAAVTSRSIADDDVQTFLVSDTGATYSPGDWLEPKDGSDQRMMVVGTGQTAGAAAFGVAGNVAQGISAAQGLLLPAAADGPTTLSVVCMQISGTIPTRGARYFSQSKAPETAVQSCQRDCVLAGGDAIQGCVWRCEETATGSAPAPEASGEADATSIREVPAILDGSGTKQTMLGAPANFEVTNPGGILNGQ